MIPVERIATRIYLIRGERVMLDSDLAELYVVPTSALNQQVKRNVDRFPEDFAFQLTVEEFESLMSQIAPFWVLSPPAERCTGHNTEWRPPLKCCKLVDKPLGIVIESTIHAFRQDARTVSPNRKERIELLMERKNTFVTKDLTD